MIDLHLHTTASDGRSTPARLIQQARAAGLHTIAVTDHDTVAALVDVRAEAASADLDVVAGIEITAVSEGRDLHILGYFVDDTDEQLLTFLAEQRADRRRRAIEIMDRLSSLGIHLPAESVLGDGCDRGRAIGRPAVARALVDGGFAADIDDAFGRFLGRGGAAFVERRGAPPEAVITLIVEAGGLASFAHPGKTGRDDLLPALVRHGLGAIEVFHPDHTDADVARYLAAAEGAGVAVTGGSDYHGPGSGRSAALGRVTLPAERYAALLDRTERR